MVRIAVGQIEPVIGDLDGNLDKLELLLEEANGKEVDVLVIPELANSGYVFESSEEARSLSEKIPSGPFSKSLAEWSIKGGFIVAGICEQASNGLYNSAAAFADGNHLGTYRKIHLFSNEADWFHAGTDEPPVYEHNGVRYGLMICFDWVFPEMTRILALKGAQVILHPANLVLPYCQDAMITRSIENRVFTATANRIGVERNLTFSGCSQITSPKGDVLFRLESTYVGMNYVDIDPAEADDKKLTKRNDVLGDRKPALYHKLVEGS